MRNKFPLFVSHSVYGTLLKKPELRQWVRREGGNIYIYMVEWCWLNLFYWSVLYLQSCVNFCCAAKWFSYIYTLFYYDLSQGTKYGFLCYRVGPCCLFTLDITARTCEPWTPNPTLSPTSPPLWKPQVCSLGLWVCFCFIDKFVYVIL